MSSTMLESLEVFHDITKLEDIAIFKKNFSLPLDEAEKLDGYSFTFSFVDSIEATNDNNKFLIIKKITISILSEDSKELATIGVAFTFLFDNQHSHISKTDTGFKLNAKAGLWLDNVIIATTRGIMYSELRGTFVEDALLPLIKPSSLKGE